MALTLNGSTGLSGIVGSAGTPALQGTDTNTGYFFGTDILGLSTAGSERLRITATGNLALGNDGSFPIYTDTNDRNFILGTGSDDAAIQLHSGTDKFGGIYFGDTTSGADRYIGYVEYKHNDNYLRFATANSERLRIDSSGNLLVKTTTQNTHVGLKADSTAINFTLGSTSGSSPRMYFYGTGNGQSSAGDIFTGTGSGGILHFRSAGLIKFEVNSDNSTAEALSIGADKNVTITDGDLVIGTAGHGIDFSAQTTTPQGGASSDDELFNHYEEGDWTPEPVITYQGGTGALSAIQDQYGRYVRAGRYVQVWFYVKFTAANITNCNVGLNGLPFTISNDAQWNSGFNGGIARRGVTGGETYVCEGMGKNGTQISVLRKYNNYGFTDTTQSIGGEACYLVD